MLNHVIERGTESIHGTTKQAVCSLRRVSLMGTIRVGSVGYTAVVTLYNHDGVGSAPVHPYSVSVGLLVNAALCGSLQVRQATFN